MGIEFELKYRATEAQLSALEAAFPGDAQMIRMHTRYYDTKDRAFSQRKLTLRCRLENGQPVCTLKTPADGNARAGRQVLRARRDSLPFTGSGAPERSRFQRSRQ